MVDTVEDAAPGQRRTGDLIAMTMMRTVGMSRALGLCVALGVGIGCGRSGPTVAFSTEPANTGVVGAPAESLSRCRGVASGIPLEAVGLDPSDLADGVRCVAADFDGNGSRDVVLYGDSLAADGGRMFYAAFTEGQRVIHHFAFSHPGVGDLVQYEPTAREGEFGEPASTHPGLVQWGEGGTTFVFLYDQTAQRFTIHELASENF